MSLVIPSDRKNLMNKKISVIMACYNCEDTLRAAIDSILRQTYTEWEMICCNDGSSDGTLAILNEYKEKYPDRIIVIDNGSNKKLPYSLNSCLSQVKTELVARMDADDVCSPDRFEIQVKYLSEHPECDLIGTGIAVSDGSTVKAEMILPSIPEPKDMLHCSCFNHATIMTYKRIYDELGGYSLEKRAERCEDVDLWSRFMQRGFVGHNIPDLLYTVIEDDNAVKRRSLSSRINLAKTRRVICKRLGLRGFSAIKRTYGQILLAFIPTPIYKWLHLKRIAKNSSKVTKNNDQA